MPGRRDKDRYQTSGHSPLAILGAGGEQPRRYRAKTQCLPPPRSPRLPPLGGQNRQSASTDATADRAGRVEADQTNRKQSNVENNQQDFSLIPLCLQSQPTAI